MEVLEVGLEHVQVRERVHEVAELHHIIPQEDVVCQCRPAGHIFLEALVHLSDGQLPRAFDGAEHDVDVVGGPDVLGRAAGLLVGERGDDLVGEASRHLVDKV